MQGGMHEPGKRLVVFFVPLSVSPQDIPILGKEGEDSGHGERAKPGMREYVPLCTKDLLEGENGLCFCF